MIVATPQLKAIRAVHLYLSVVVSSCSHAMYRKGADTAVVCISPMWVDYTITATVDTKQDIHTSPATNTTHNNSMTFMFITSVIAGCIVGGIGGSEFIKEKATTTTTNHNSSSSDSFNSFSLSADIPLGGPISGMVTTSLSSLP